MRFKEKKTDYLWDAKQMPNGIIIRQAPPYDMNIEFLSNEEFEERFDEFSG